MSKVQTIKAKLFMYTFLSIIIMSIIGYVYHCHNNLRHIQSSHNQIKKSNSMIELIEKQSKLLDSLIIINDSLISNFKNKTDLRKGGKP